MRRRYSAVALSLLFAMTLLAAALPSRTRAVGEAPDCTITKDPGAAASDPIDGTAGDDVICGTAGDDIINGLGGNDTIWGGGGNDTITGGAGTDTIYGEDGNDHLDGGEGDDTEYAGDGDDYVAGGPGADSLFAGDGSDALKGDAGDDSLNGEDGNDQIEGGTGDDAEYGGPGADRLFGGDGSDALLAEAGNDYIDGGAGADSGSGGDGVDYCTQATGETISSCFNDASGPQLVSVAVSPTSIDTSAGSQMVTVRMRIKDNGAGITGYCDEGVQYTEGGVDCSSWRVGGYFTSGNREYWYGLDSRACLPTGHRDGYGSEGSGGMCRISGTPNNGIYEGAFWVKRYTPRTTFKLTWFFATDDAGNKNKGTTLEASFKQTSLGDGVGPQLIDAAFCVPDANDEQARCVEGATIDTSASNQTVKLRVRVKDAGSGLADSGLYLGIASAPLANASAGRGDGLQIPAESAPVLISGTANDGVYEQTYLVPKNFPKSRIYLYDFSAEDLAGNITRWGGWGGDGMGSLLMQKNLHVSFKQVGAGDATPPSIKSLSFSPNSVNVSSEGAWVTVTFRMVDATGLYPARDGSYVGYDFSGLGGCLNDAGRNVDFCFGTQNGLLESCPVDLSELNSFACRVSGTAQDGVYKTSLSIPRNARKGVLTVGWILAADSLGNEVYYQPDIRSGIPRSLDKTVTVQ